MPKKIDDTDNVISFDEYQKMRDDVRRYGFGPGTELRKLEREDRAFLLYQTWRYEHAHALPHDAYSALVADEVAWWQGGMDNYIGC